MLHFYGLSDNSHSLYTMSLTETEVFGGTNCARSVTSTCNSARGVRGLFIGKGARVMQWLDVCLVSPISAASLFCCSVHVFTIQREEEKGLCLLSEGGLSQFTNKKGMKGRTKIVKCHPSRIMSFVGIYQSGARVTPHSLGISCIRNRDRVHFPDLEF